MNPLSGLKRVVAGTGYKAMGLLLKRPFSPHIAFFGGSGSGKTTALSVFFGYQSSNHFGKTQGYRLVACDPGQHTQLIQRYERITEGDFPPHTRYHWQAFNFEVRVPGAKGHLATLTWYDYPGEWLEDSPCPENEKDPKREKENDRKLEALRHLMRSDVAFLLIDGAKYKASGPGYLSAALRTVWNEIDRQKDQLINSHTKIIHYPKIWVIALTKADLFGEQYTAEEFHCQLLRTARDEVEGLRQTIGEMVTNPKHVSIGDHYLLLSSAEFDPTGQRVLDARKILGLDLILPISLLAPLSVARQIANVAGKGSWKLVDVVDVLRHLSLGWLQWMPFIGRFFQLLNQTAKETIASLQRMRKEAADKGDAKWAAICGMQELQASDKGHRAYYARCE